MFRHLPKTHQDLINDSIGGIRDCAESLSFIEEYADSDTDFMDYEEIIEFCNNIIAKATTIKQIIKENKKEYKFEN